ncbi:PAS domain-containing protein [Ephemerocybe angulata]|uniref:PAS domain-containing protein n=1 Tax=Ephemerocybe angulata TaxID=980116 RepID=A0A8H6HKP4_9AGAR|nr:PAS domain-containing protein [Tulosesus angulatus]
MTSEAFPPQYSSFSPFGYVDEPLPPRTHQRSASEEAMEMFQTSDVQFQVPHYLYATPALASGGGAEVLPTGMINGDTWLANNVNGGYSKSVSIKSKDYSKEVDYFDPLSFEQPTRQATIAGNPNASVFDYEELIAAPVPRNPPSSTTQTSLFSPPFQVDCSLFAQGGSAASAPRGSGFEPQQQRPQQPHQAPSQSQSQTQSHVVELIAPPTVGPRIPASTLGLPVYSATGFDALSILARVFSRPYPRVHLGPVDLTCSFVVVDTRRHDSPIIYCSPNFAKLTGYHPRDVVGRNCRFLQSPTGQLDAQGPRPDPASQAAAAHLKKNLAADKECQAVITNYRKDGTPFSNLVTVIPIYGGVANQPHEEQEVVFHVGFQVDLTEQPKAILENMQTGAYVVDYPQRHDAQPHARNGHSSAGMHGGGRERRAIALPPVLVSKEMKKMLACPQFLRSIPITTRTNYPQVASNSSSSSSSSSSSAAAAAAGETPLDSVFGGNHPLHMMLLEVGPDFVHIVSLKGSFLYVAPAVRRVLGYEPDDLVGASLADLAHPEDVVPMMRELKESSSTATGAVGPGNEGSSLGALPGVVNPRTVDLLFRAKTKNGRYVWVESRGRLHVEPGKGRKAIILTGRVREMSDISWEMVARGGGLAKSLTVQRPTEEGGVENVLVKQEFWGTMNKSMVLLTIGSGIKDVLGWDAEEFVGRTMDKLVQDSDSVAELEAHAASLGKISDDAEDYEALCASATCRMRAKDGSIVVVVVNTFRCQRDPGVRFATSVKGGVPPAHLLYQVRLASAEVHTLYHQPEATPSAPSPCPDLLANVFQALDITRGSSWQYELQQLKFGNQRLVDEIATLEAAIKASKAKKEKAAQAAAQAQIQVQPPMRYGAPRRSFNLQRPPPGRFQQGMPSHSGMGGSMGYPTAALPMRAGGDNFGSRYNDYLGTSPYVQRVQEDVAMQAAAAREQQGYYEQGPAMGSLKRSWGVMEGGGFAR